MSRTSDQILRDIGSFEPSSGNWLGLENLLEELWSVGVPNHGLPTLFGVFERFPEDDGAGVFWSIVHGVESLEVDYETPLRESLLRKQSEMGQILLDRLERSKAG